MKSAPVLLTLSDSKHVVLPVDDDSDLNVVAAFDRRGEYIYTGNAKGKVSPLCVLLLQLSLLSMISIGFISFIEQRVVGKASRCFFLSKIWILSLFAAFIQPLLSFIL